MKRLFFAFLICCITTALAAQTAAINKPLKDFPNVYDLSTPLNAGVTISYFFVNGTMSQFHDASSYMNSLAHQKGTLSDRIVDEAYKERLLNDTIKEVVVYKDFVACMITKHNSDYSIRVLVFEDGKWLNLCEDGRNSMEEVRNRTCYQNKNG
ncbi:MAG: hypothetical protein FWC34_05560 [Bacteroidetes bacterium]|nr:hypothetical protein [Bacteroidota bacterium]MCL2303113.1 hypothetical protein [Lentimicrobiaceae bacterium]